MRHLSVGPAADAPLPVELEWEAPADCPDRSVVLERVRDHAVSLEEPPRPIHARAAVAADAGGYAVHLVIDGEDGGSEHELTSRHCDVLANATAFMIAVAMDPVAKAEADTRHLETPASSVEPTPRVSPRPADPAPAREGPAESAARRPALGFVEAAGGVQLAQLGPATPIVRLEAGVRLGWARLGVAASYLTPVARDLDDSDGQLRLQQWSVGVSGCALPRAGRVEFPVCVAFAGGQVRGRTSGIAAPASDTQVASFGALSSGVLWAPRPRIGLGLRGETWVNIARGNFEVGGLGTVFRVPVVSGSAQAVIELRLGSL